LKADKAGKMEKLLFIISRVNVGNLVTEGKILGNFCLFDSVFLKKK
jgi:hypothetical protein